MICRVRVEGRDRPSSTWFRKARLKSLPATAAKLSPISCLAFRTRPPRVDVRPEDCRFSLADFGETAATVEGSPLPCRSATVSDTYGRTPWVVCSAVQDFPSLPTMTKLQYVRPIRSGRPATFQPI